MCSDTATARDCKCAMCDRLHAFTAALVGTLNERIDDVEAHSCNTLKQQKDTGPPTNDCTVMFVLCCAESSSTASSCSAATTT